MGKEVWTVATGYVDLSLKACRKAVGYVSKLDGFVAVAQHYPDGTLWLFDSKQNAIRAKNQMDYEGIVTGRNIGHAYIKGNTLHVLGVE